MTELTNRIAIAKSDNAKIIAAAPQETARSLLALARSRIWRGQKPDEEIVLFVRAAVLLDPELLKTKDWIEFCQSPIVMKLFLEKE